MKKDEAKIVGEGNKNWRGGKRRIEKSKKNGEK